MHKSYLVLLEEKDLNVFNESLLNKHIAYLKNLFSQGYLLICGPFVNNTGALLILRCNSEENARKLVEDDPFISGEYYKSFKIYEFTEASDKNNWLINSDQTVTNILNCKEYKF